MFHILIENSTPNRLVGGPWRSTRGDSSSDVAASVLECGLKGGQVREAISAADYRGLVNSGKLNIDRACKECVRKVGGKYGGKRKDTETVERQTNADQTA